MSGHNKWANIKERKTAQDAKKAKIYHKIIKEVMIAVHQAGPDPGDNPRLRLAIQNARGVNLPKDNILRAIKKAAGEGNLHYLSTTYEGYGPHGVAVIVEGMTDNQNRTVGAVRSLFNKYGGSLAKSGSVSHLFDHKGTFLIPTTAIQDLDAATLALIDAGVEDIEQEEAYYYFTCPLEAFGKTQQTLEVLGIVPEEAALRYLPHTMVEVEAALRDKVQRMVDALEELEDVQYVYHNMATPQTYNP